MLEAVQSMPNQELLDRGLPASLVLPPSRYWRTNRAFTSTQGIWNFDPVRTNPAGSMITLNARTSNQFGSGVVLGESRVSMSNEADTWTIRAQRQHSLSDIALSIEGAGDSYLSRSPGVLDLSGGANTINIGEGWRTGLRIGSAASLIGGQGVDRIRSIGSDSGVSVYGTINLGRGNDTIVARSESGDSAFHVDNSGHVEMGNGRDRITGIGGARSIYINGRVDMGAGADRITGNSLHLASSTQAILLMGHGNDSITSPLVHSNDSTLDFGPGQDSLALRPGIYSVVAQASPATFFLQSESMSNTTIVGLEYFVSSVTGNRYPVTEGSVSIV